MGDSKKLLTIIVPAYNVQNYVGDCLDSLVRQTLNNHKVIIVDDGSKDERTSEICKSYAEQYPDMFTYVHQENQGLGAARNTGLALADTDYVGFLDSDDWLVSNYVERVTEEIEKYYSEEVDIVFTLPTIYDSVTQVFTPWNDAELFNTIFCDDSKIVSAQEEFRLYDLEVSACRRIFRLNFLKEHNFKFPEGIKWEDVYPHFYLLYHANRCLGIEDVGFRYRINTPGQITNLSDFSRLDVVKVFAKTFSFGLSEKCNSEILKSMLRMLNSFAMWSLDNSNPEVRQLLVKRLHELYKIIPNDLVRTYLKERKNYRKECLFIRAMRTNQGIHLYKDYFSMEVLLNLAHRLRRK